MSTSTQTKSSVESVVATISPEDVFDDVVWENREICNGCFARIRSVTEHDRRAWGRSNVPDSASQCVVDGVRGNGAEDHGDYNERTTYPWGPVFCGNCGSQSGAASDDPLSRRRALELTGTLVDRVQEAGVDVDVRAVIELVRECQSRPNLQGADTEIFRRATTFGVRRARRRRS